MVNDTILIYDVYIYSIYQYTMYHSYRCYPLVMTNIANWKMDENGP